MKSSGNPVKRPKRVSAPGLRTFISATAQADGWFEVKYEDMGYPGTTRIKAVEQNGRILLDDFSSPFCP